MSEGTTTDNNVIVISIDGRWDAEEMATFLNHCARMYYFSMIEEALPRTSLSASKLRKSFQDFIDITRLRVKALNVLAIRYGSPGDLVFSGAALGIASLATMLMALKSYSLDRKIKEQQLIKLQQENQNNPHLTTLDKRKKRIEVEKAEIELAAMKRKQRLDIIHDMTKDSVATDKVILLYYAGLDASLAFCDEKIREGKITNIASIKETL